MVMTMPEASVRAVQREDTTTCDASAVRKDMTTTSNTPTTRFHPRLGLLRTIVADGRVWYEARSTRKILWYGDGAPLPPLPDLKTEIIIEYPGGAGLFYDSSALRALAVASPAPAGLATTFLEWVDANT